MLKKQLGIALITMLSCGSALANGFYIGGGAGVLQLTNKSSTAISFDPNPEDMPVQTSSNNPGTNMNINGTILGGYQWSFANRFALAIEAFTNLSSAKISDSYSIYNLEGTNDLTLNSTYGVRILPGYQITPATEIYTILGYARSQATVDSNITVASTASYNGASVSSSSDYTLNGYQIGLGTKIDLTDVSPHLAVRTDVIYTGYDSKTNNLSMPSTGLTTNNTYKVQPSTLEANVVLLYQFG